MGTALAAEEMRQCLVVRTARFGRPRGKLCQLSRRLFRPVVLDQDINRRYLAERGRRGRRVAVAGERRGEDSRLRRVNMPECSMGALCCQGILLVSISFERDEARCHYNVVETGEYPGCSLGVE